MKEKLFVLVIIFCLSTLVHSSSFIISGDSTVTIYRVQVVTNVNSIDTAAGIKQQILSYGISTAWIFPASSGWRVVAGVWPTRSEATATLNLIQSKGYSSALIVTNNISVAKAQSWNLPLQSSPTAKNDPVPQVKPASRP